MSDEVTTGMCWFCERWCAADDYCHGCRKFLCEAHAGFALLTGHHAPEDHLADGAEDDR